LPSLTQHTFIQPISLPSRMFYMFWPILTQYSGVSTQKHIQENTIKIYRASSYIQGFCTQPKHVAFL